MNIEQACKGIIIAKQRDNNVLSVNQLHIYCYNPIYSCIYHVNFVTYCACVTKLT